MPVSTVQGVVSQQLICVKKRSLLDKSVWTNWTLRTFSEIIEKTLNRKLLMFITKLIFIVAVIGVVATHKKIIYNISGGSI